MSLFWGQLNFKFDFELEICYTVRPLNWGHFNVVQSQKQIVLCRDLGCQWMLGMFSIRGFTSEDCFMAVLLMTLLEKPLSIVDYSFYASLFDDPMPN